MMLTLGLVPGGGRAVTCRSMIVAGQPVPILAHSECFGASTNFSLGEFQLTERCQIESQLWTPKHLKLKEWFITLAQCKRGPKNLCGLRVIARLAQYPRQDPLCSVLLCQTSSPRVLGLEFRA